jgi:hypothetical protein
MFKRGKKINLKKQMVLALVLSQWIQVGPTLVLLGSRTLWVLANIRLGLKWLTMTHFLLFYSWCLLECCSVGFNKILFSMLYDKEFRFNY